MKIRKAVIPAAGLGTRFLPATKAQPKEMLPIVDKPTIQYIVEEAAASGIECIVIIIGRNKRAIEDHFDRSIELELALENKHNESVLKMIKDISEIVDIIYIRQKSPLGLGHAIYTARECIGDEPFGVLLGDDIVKSKVPALQQLIAAYDEFGAPILGVQRVPYSAVDKYGIVATSGHPEERIYKVSELVEKPLPEEAPSDLAILGRYILTPAIFDAIEQTKPGKGGEIQLTDALSRLLQKEPIYAYEFEGMRYDVGDKLGFLKATCEFALDRPDLKEGFQKYLQKLVGGEYEQNPEY